MLDSQSDKHPWSGLRSEPSLQQGSDSAFENGWSWRNRTCGPNRSLHAVHAVSGQRSEKEARVEAALFVADGPLTVRKLCQAAVLADSGEAREIIRTLNTHYDAEGSAFRIERVAGGFRLLTRPIYARWLSKIHQRQSELKLSPPAMETLTIVAYCQPVTRADVEAIRGVQSTDLLKQLLERGLIKICGEENSLGRPYLYDTTRKFLELFGLKTLNELPSASTLRRKPQTQSIATETSIAAKDAANDMLEPDAEDEAVTDAA